MISLLVSALAASSGSGVQTVSVPDSILTAPAISNGRVVFSYAGDLYVAGIEDGSPARRLTSDRGTETAPRISPDGKTLAFLGGYEGGNEVYTIPMDGGEPTRLTYEAGGKTLIGWTPDGKSIAYGTPARNFTNRQAALYLVPAAGGPAKATAVKEIGEGAFLPDGRLVYVRQNSVNFNWRRYRGGSQGKISIYDLRTNAYRELPAKREQNFSPVVLAPDQAVFLSDRDNGTLNLYRADLKSNRVERLTNEATVDLRTPATDGKTVVFEREGRLMLLDLATKKVRPFSPLIRSENLSARPTIKSLAPYIESAATNDAGTRAYVIARGELFSVSTKTGDTQNLTNSSGSRERAPLLSPDAKTLYYVSDRTSGSGPGEDDVYVRDLASGKERTLGVARLKPTGMTLAPDGKTLAVTNSQAQLFLVDVATGSARELPKGFQGIRSFAFSPDSKVIAAIRVGENDFGRVVLFPVETGAQGLPAEGREITSGRFDDQDLDFSSDGKYLFLASLRAPAPTFGQYEFSLKVQDAVRLYALPLAADTPNPFVEKDESEEAPTPASAPPTTALKAGIVAPPAAPPVAPPVAPPAKPETKPDVPAPAPPTTYALDGVERRLVPLPLPGGEYAGLTSVPGGLLYRSGPVLFRFDLAAKSATPVTPLFAGYTLSPRRTKIAVAGPGNVQVADIRPNLPPGTGRVDIGGIQARIDPKAEWRQIFWETWRFQRDTFYDPTFAGRNWREIGERWSKFVERAQSRADVTLALRRLVAELGTSHAYVQGAGDQGGSSGPGVAYLGADYEVRGGKVVFAKVYEGENYEEDEVGPLGPPALNVKAGDALIAVDGVPVDPNTDPGQLLLGKAGRTVVLTVQSPGGPERRIEVKPTGSEYPLRYAAWVEGNRKAVERASNGRIGYFHVSDTAAQGSIDFVKGFYAQTDKEAVIVDERYNGGGYIQPWFVDTLARQSRAYIQRPNFPSRPEAVSISGPKVMLINGYAGSGGDFFPYMFRQSKLGPLVGERTWGGLVGISTGLQTVDGQSVTSPGFAIFNPETGEIIAENTGIEPDVEVDYRPDLVAQGRDPQLEKAIEILLAELKKLPAKKPYPTVPRLNRNGQVPG